MEVLEESKDLVNVSNCCFHTWLNFPYETA